MNDEYLVFYDFFSYYNDITRKLAMIKEMVETYVQMATKILGRSFPTFHLPDWRLSQWSLSEFYKYWLYLVVKEMLNDKRDGVLICCFILNHVWKYWYLI